MFAGYRWADRGKRHAVLQLVPEAIGATGLVETGSRPDTAGERLVDEPAVEHDVHRPVRRFDLDCADDLIPKSTDLGEHSVQVRLTVARDQRLRLRLVLGVAE